MGDFLTEELMNVSASAVARSTRSVSPQTQHVATGGPTEIRRAVSRWLTCGLLLCLWSSPAISQDQEEDAAELSLKYVIGDAVSLSNKEYPEVEKALQRFRNRDAEGAQEYLALAKEKYPKLPPADIMMAKMQILNRNAQAVQFYLERATTQTPEDPEAYLMLADAAFKAQRTAESLAMFEYAAPLVEKFAGNAKRKNRFDVRIVAGRAAVAERRQQWEKASDYLKQWIAIDPENAMAHTRMGIVYFRLNEAKPSLAEFSKARSIDPALPHPFVSLGKLFTANGDNDKARKSFEKAYQEGAADPQVAQAYIEWLIQQEELDTAHTVVQKLLELDADSANSYVLDGIVAYMRDQMEDAERSLQKVLSLDPRNARATDMLAILLIKSDNAQDRERALQYAQSNVERYANNAQANITLAYVLYELDRKADAQKVLNKMGQLNPQPDSTFLITKILVREGQTEKARATLQQLVAQVPGPLIFRKEAQELLEELTPTPAE
jgi:tetratricopeptide (TPR) repeat protein